MATVMHLKGIQVKFKKIAGHTGMPLEPTTVTLDDTPANVVSALQTAIAGLTGAGALADGETMQIIISGKEIEE